MFCDKECINNERCNNLSLNELFCPAVCENKRTFLIHTGTQIDMVKWLAKIKRPIELFPRHLYSEA